MPKGDKYIKLKNFLISSISLLLDCPLRKLKRLLTVNYRKWLVITVHGGQMAQQAIHSPLLG